MTDQMTNRNQHIQPASRPFNLLVRGGRLTRFKGQVASLAPGLSVVATAAVLLIGGVEQATAQAADACGGPTNGAVTCAADTYADGITYNISGTDDFSLILDNPDMTVGGSGAWAWGSGDISVQLDNGKVITDGSAAFAPGLWAQMNNTASTATATVRMTDGEINTTGSNHHGVLADNKGLGDAIAQMSGGKITASGGSSYGLWATVGHAQSTASATASVTGGEINAGGAAAIFANNQGLGAATASLQDATVTTSAVNGRGLLARITNADNEATATAEVINGEIITNRDNAYGIWVDQFGRGGSLALLENSTVSTDGENAEGLWAETRNENNTANTEARVINGHVTTRGFAANAVFTTHTGSGDSIVRAVGDTTITTYGGSSHGLAASGYGANKAIVELGAGAVVRVYGENAVGLHAEGGTGFDVDVAGEVTGGAGDGAAIRAYFLGSPPSDASGTIDIASTGKVTAGSSGYAIQVDGSGAAVITSAGTITGDIRLGAGNDTLTLTGGSFTGDLDAGAGDDTVTLGATANFDFSHVLDGGAGDNDQLILQGQQGEKSITTTADRFVNWQGITLNDTTLSLDGVVTLPALSIDAMSEFRASGEGGGITVSGDVTNNGSVILSVQDGEADDVIRIEGNYTGSGSSVFALDTVLQGDGSNSDRVVITGDTSGEMILSISGLDSIAPGGAPLEIDLVSVEGTSDGTFTLMGGNYVTPNGEQAVIAGAHLYTLADTGRGWALSALSETGETNYQPSAPVYDSYGQSLLALNGPKSLRNRGSSEDFRILAWEGGTDDQDSGSPLWLRMGADRITLSEENSTTGAALESTVWEMEVGADIVLREIGSGLLVGGLMGSYAMGSASVTSAFGDGSIDTTGLGLGVAATWYDTRRFYVDGQVTLAAYTSDLEADRLGTLTEENSGTGFAVSLEAGQQLDLGSRLTVIPQAQLSVSSVAFSDFASEARGEQVTFEDASSQQLRLGLEFGLQEQEARRLYGIVNLFYEFGPGSEVDVTGVALTTESEPWATGVGLGGTYVWNDRVGFFGETSYTTGLGNVGDTSALSANAGFKVTF